MIHGRKSEGKFDFQDPPELDGFVSFFRFANYGGGQLVPSGDSEDGM